MSTTPLGGTATRMATAVDIDRAPRRPIVAPLIIAIGALWPWAALGGQAGQIATLAAGTGLAIAQALLRRQPFPIGLALVTFGLGALLGAQALGELDFTAQNYLLCAIVGIIAVGTGLGPSLRTMFVVALAISTVVQAFEIATSSYMFTVVSRDVELDIDLFRGATELIRAKGIFYGPVTAAMFAVLVAVIHRGNWRVWLLALASAALAQGRVAVLLLVIGGVLFLGASGSRALIKRIAALAAVAVVVLGTWFLLLDDLTRANYLSAFDITDRRNSARFAYWDAGWNTYQGSDFANQLVGNPGATYREFFNSSENDYLQILNDTGLLGLVLLLTAAVLLARISRNRWLILVIPAALFAATFASVSVGIVLWVTLGTAPSTTTKRRPQATARQESTARYTYRRP